MNKVGFEQMSSEEVIKQVVKLGYTVKRFTLSTEGSYKPQDAIWNKKDIAHFEHAHTQVVLGGIHYGSVAVFTRFFKFLGMDMPLLNVVLDEGPNKVSYIFSFLNFYFINSFTEELLDDSGCGKSRSDTETVIGCRSKILLNLFLPFFKHMFKRSFQFFLDEDVPLQERRAWLRDRGYVFSRDTEEYDFHDTLDLTQRNIKLGPNIKTPETLVTPLTNFPEGKMTKIGSPDLFGFQVFRDNTSLTIFPRLCPHEGGCLDLDSGVGGYLMESNFKGRVRCNFHKRYFAPIASLPLREGETATARFSKFEIAANNLVINFYQLTNNRINEDWTKQV
jgi:hypothetical protein